ncbi:MAG: cytochrome c oxidase subunit 3 [Pyrinomonadaceae bacterium]
MKYKVGELDIEAEAEVPKRRVRTGSGLGGGGGNGGNNGNRGGGGGGDRKDNDRDNHADHEQFTPSKYYLGMQIALLVILMTFAGLVSAYVFIAFNKTQEWKPFDLPFQVFVSTFLILASSVSLELAKYAIKAGNQKRFWNWLMVTTGLGATFISSQMFAWFELARSGIYVAGNPYAGFFYILTIAHAVHLIGGILALGYLVVRTSKPTRNAEILFKRQTAAGVVGLYWHSMDGLWLVLLALLGFLK